MIMYFLEMNRNESSRSSLRQRRKRQKVIVISEAVTTNYLLTESEVFTEISQARPCRID